MKQQYHLNLHSLPKYCNDSPNFASIRANKSEVNRVSNSFDCILEKLDKKIDNISMIAKESEMRDCQIKQQMETKFKLNSSRSSQESGESTFRNLLSNRSNLSQEEKLVPNQIIQRKREQENSKELKVKEEEALPINNIEQTGRWNEKFQKDGIQGRQIMNKKEEISQIEELNKQMAHPIRLEDLIKQGSKKESDFVFFNWSVYEECKQIYDNCQYVIFTKGDFDKAMNLLQQKQIQIESQNNEEQSMQNQQMPETFRGNLEQEEEEEVSQNKENKILTLNERDTSQDNKKKESQNHTSHPQIYEVKNENQFQTALKVAESLQKEVTQQQQLLKKQNSPFNNGHINHVKKEQHIQERMNTFENSNSTCSNYNSVDKPTQNASQYSACNTFNTAQSVSIEESYNKFHQARLSSNSTSSSLHSTSTDGTNAKKQPSFYMAQVSDFNPSVMCIPSHSKATLPLQSNTGGKYESLQMPSPFKIPLSMNVANTSAFTPREQAPSLSQKKPPMQPKCIKPQSQADKICEELINRGIHLQSFCQSSENQQPSTRKRQISYDLPRTGTKKVEEFVQNLKRVDSQEKLKGQQSERTRQNSATRQLKSRIIQGNQGSQVSQDSIVSNSSFSSKVMDESKNSQREDQHASQIKDSQKTMSQCLSPPSSLKPPLIRHTPCNYQSEVSKQANHQLNDQKSSDKLTSPYFYLKGANHQENNNTPNQRRDNSSGGKVIGIRKREDCSTIEKSSKQNEGSILNTSSFSDFNSFHSNVNNSFTVNNLNTDQFKENVLPPNQLTAAKKNNQQVLLSSNSSTILPSNPPIFFHTTNKSAFQNVTPSSKSSQQLLSHCKQISNISKGNQQNISESYENNYSIFNSNKMGSENVKANSSSSNSFLLTSNRYAFPDGFKLSKEGLGLQKQRCISSVKF